MSERLTLSIDIDQSAANIALMDMNAQLDDFTRRQREARQQLKQFVRDASQVFTNIWMLYRTMAEASGQVIDELLVSFMNVLQGAISVAITTIIIAEAQKLIGNFLGIIAAFLASVALGRSLRALFEVAEARAKNEETISRVNSQLNEVLRLHRTPIGF